MTRSALSPAKIKPISSKRVSTRPNVSKAPPALPLELFKRMSREVPAYKKHLAASGISAHTIRSHADLEKIPPITKANYLRAYPYKDLFWDGSVRSSHVLTSTSGSTGEPFFFARTHSVDEQSALIHERFFLQSSFSEKKSTLVVVCFSMGVWIGGLITYQAFELLSRRGYPFSIITPGINKVEIFKILRNLAPNYEQVILTGYPPFIKDILDEASPNGVDLKRFKMGIVFAAEAFTEQFRDYIAKKANIENALTDTVNIYGTADIGTTSSETPLSILVRRLALTRPEAFKELFGEISKTPTLAQFIPQFTHFEEKNGQLYLSGNSAMPLFRYGIGDNGGVLMFDQIAETLKKHGVDLKKEMKKAKVSSTNAAMPFVYVYERADLSTTLYGLQVYPEPIRETLLEAAPDIVSGRFALLTRYDKSHNQYLEVNIELHKGQSVPDGLEAVLRTAIVTNLRKKNGEFRELSNFLGERANPRIVFWKHEDPKYFRRDTKQRWVIKEK